MNFRDIGIIITKKPLKENMVIMSIFTEQNGLYSAVVREPKKNGSIYQEGNLVDFFWRARLHEHIGSAKCELIKSYNSSLILDKTKLYAFNSIISLMKLAFHEREPHNNFFATFNDYLKSLASNFIFEDYIRLELEILAEAGYRLELGHCAVTDATEGLCYVSPKSGNAISLTAGLPFASKLLSLPKFLIDPTIEITKLETKQAFDLTGYFFNRYLFENHNEPYARRVFGEHITRNVK
jgi:DNA repair protein RecO (recombination protein O)